MVALIPLAFSVSFVPSSPAPFKQQAHRRCAQQAEFCVSLKRHINKLQCDASTKFASPEENQKVLQCNKCVTADLANYLIKFCFSV